MVLAGRSAEKLAARNKRTGETDGEQLLQVWACDTKSLEMTFVDIAPDALSLSPNLLSVL